MTSINILSLPQLIRRINASFESRFSALLRLLEIFYKVEQSIQCLGLLIKSQYQQRPTVYRNLRSALQ